MNLKLQNFSKVSTAFLMTLFSVWGWGQGTLVNPVFSENFGTLADGTDLTTANTAFSWIRVGTSTGSASINNEIVAKNPSVFTGSSGLIGAKGGSVSTVDKTGLSSFNTGAFTFRFRTPASLTSATMVAAVGSGSSFGSTNGFTGAQLSAAFQINGTNLQIRTSGGWTTVQTVTASTNYTVAIVFNNTTGSLSYGDGNTLPANRTDIWINGVKTSGQYVAATSSLSATAFRIYTTTAEYEVDDIAVYNTLPTASATTWNGTSWSNGNPSSTLNAVINADYTGASFTSNSLTVNAAITLTINSGQTVTAGNVTNNGNIIVNDGGNFIQTVGSTYTTGSGSSFVANRNSASVVNKYVFWSSPVADQNIFTAYTSGPSASVPAYVMTYNTGSNLYDLVTNADNNFVANTGKGYSVKVPQDNAGLSFGGTNKTPNNGAVNLLLNGATGGINYNLIGNPYPSNLDLNAFYTANNSAVESTFWFWDNTTGNVTTQSGDTSVNVGYATVNAASGTWTEAPGTQSYNSAALNATGNIAKTGQGFIVKAANAGTVSFTNAMRVSANGVTLNKNGDTNTGKFWIRLTTSYGNTVTQAVTYSQGASNAYDVYDSKAMAMGSDAFYSLADAEKVIIQGRAPFSISDAVPLGIKHFENGNFIISLSHKEGLFTNGQPVYLHDKSTGTYTDLQNQAYAFTGNAGQFENRFEIVYKLDVLAISEAYRDTFEVYRDGEDFFVRNNKNIETVEIFDTAGRKIKDITGNSKLVRITLESKGLYIFKVRSAGKEYSRKVVK